MRAPHRLAVTLLSVVTLGAVASAASPAPEPPLAELAGPHGALRILRDGKLVSSGGEVIAALQVDGDKPERAWLKLVEIGGEKLVEAGGWRGRHGRVLLVRTAEHGGVVLLDEPSGRNADGELERHLQLAADGPRRWQSSPGVRRCDGVPPLFLERYDLARKVWEPLALPVPAAPELAPSSRALPPPRRALRFSSGSADGSSERADYLGAPRQLDDQTPSTVLSLGHGPRVRGAFMTAQAPHAVDLVAVRVDPVAAPHRLPAALVLVGGQPARPLHRLPLGPRGATFVLPRSVTGSCVTFVVDDDGHGPDVALSEITLYGADDAPEAQPLRARAVATQAADAEDAARALEAIGPSVAGAVLDALPEGTPDGRRRLLSILFFLRAKLAPEVAPRLGKLLETAHGQERRLITGVLADMPMGAQAEAERVLADRSQASEARIDAIEILRTHAATRAPSFAPLLLGAMADADPLVAREARRGAVEAARQTPLLAEEALRLLGTPDPAAPPALIAVLGAAHPVLEAAPRKRVVDAIAALGGIETLPFELAVRVLSALTALDRPTATRAIGEVLARSKDATLRLVAVDALPASTEQGALRMLLSRAAKDGDARVREHGLARMLPSVDVIGSQVFEEATGDAWPEVRRVAYAGLGRSCAANPAVATCLEARIFERKTADADPRSRAEALAAYARCPAVPYDKLIAATGDKQPAEVRERAAALLGGLGPRVLPAITRALDKTFERGGPDMPVVAVALLRAIGRIGGGPDYDELDRSGKRTGPEPPFDDATLVMLRDAAADPFYPGIRMAALDALARGCPVGAKVVFDRADQDPEPAVQRASALGRSLCKR